jgi:tetratricopeptide (TPR) repeat protein
LDTTRAYALEIGLDRAERNDLACRHANYYRQWLEQSGMEWPSLSTGAERAPHFAGLNNVRAALEWCFGNGGNTEIGVGLAAAAAPVFMAMSLFTECLRWSERAMLALGDDMRGGSEEMHLQAGLGMSLMFTQGESDAAHAALNRSLGIAEASGDVLSQVRLLSPLHLFHLRTGDFKSCLRYAERSFAVATIIGDPAAIALARSLAGISHHLLGDLGSARVELEAALEYGPGSRRISTIYVDFDHYNWAAIALARTLWLQGHPAQAVERAHRAVKDAERMDHPISLAIVLNWAASMFLWAGDLADAEKHIDWFISRAESHSFGPYLDVGRGRKGALAVRRGDAKSGVENLQGCLEKLHAARYELLTTEFNISLIQGLAAIGQFAKATALADESIQQIATNGEVSYLPELLRVKGNLLLSMPQPSVEEAEICFTQSLELSRRQGARAWELRTATDLAALLADRGRSESAAALLQPVYKLFVEGLETADLKAAERLLAILG